LKEPKLSLIELEEGIYYEYDFILDKIRKKKNKGAQMSTFIF